MDIGLSQEPPSNTSIGGKGVSVKRRQAAPSLYFLCNYCDTAVVSVPKIKDHILKRHCIGEVTTEHYTPSFRKVYSFKSDCKESGSSCTFMCILCNNTYVSKNDVTFHVKNSHLKDVAPIVVTRRKNINTFQPPIKKTPNCPSKDISSNSSTHVPTIEKGSFVVSNVGSTESDQVPKKRKYKSEIKPKKINYYKELQNVLVDKSKTKKLQLWGGIFSLSEPGLVSEDCGKDDNQVKPPASIQSSSNIQRSVEDLDISISTEKEDSNCEELVISEDQITQARPHESTLDLNTSSLANCLVNQVSNGKRGRKPKYVNHSNKKKADFTAGYRNVFPVLSPQTVEPVMSASTRK